MIRKIKAGEIILRYEEMDVIAKNPEPKNRTGEKEIGVMDRGIVHGAWLLHRQVSIAVLTPDGKIIIQRAAAKPGERCAGNLTEIGGHVPAGKTYEETALEELQQELKLKNRPTGKLVEALWRYWSSNAEERDADIKVTYVYILNSEELDDVKKLKSGLEEMMETMSKEEYEQWLKEQQKEKAGAGEVWGLYIEDVNTLKNGLVPSR